MDKQTVKQIIRQSTKGADIAKAVGDYFKATLKQENDIVDLAEKIFNPVENPGAVTVLGQGTMAGPGF